MDKVILSVDIRDKNGHRYETEMNINVIRFDFQELNPKGRDFEKVCRRYFEEFKAISKEGSKINIEVRWFNKLTETYPLLYSFYGAENKFIKHT